MSDIHGHFDALGAVLATAERRGYDRLLVAGDLCFPGPEPLLTWRRLLQLGAVCVQGVGDRALATVDPERLRPKGEHERQRLRRLRDVRAELGGAILRQLSSLPSTFRMKLPSGDELLLVHGCPVDPTEPMCHDMVDSLLARMIGDESAALVLCGGSHVPFDRLLRREAEDLGSAEVSEFGGNSVRVVNVGSVGEAPGGDGSGRPLAHATFVQATAEGISVQQFVVPLGKAA